MAKTRGPAKAVAADMPKRRGRPAAAAKAAKETPAVAVEAAKEQPKKRGRPSKVHEAAPVEEPKVRRNTRQPPVAEAPVAEASAPAPAPKKRGGRPKKNVAVVEEAPAVGDLPKRQGRAPKATVEEAPAVVDPPKRRGRAPKAAVEAVATSTPPKRKGRAAKTQAVDLERVATSGRVTKPRSSARAKKTAAPAPAPVAAPRMDPRIRSKLRTRAAPAKAEPKQETKPAKKRIGRPPKGAVKNAVATPTKKTKSTKPAERKVKDAGVKKPTKAPRAANIKPRKRRGYTTLEIPDKHLKQVQDLLDKLLEQDAVEDRVAEENAAMADDERELAPEDPTTALGQTEDAIAQQFDAEMDVEMTDVDEMDDEMSDKPADDVADEPADDMADEMADVQGGAQQDDAPEQLGEGEFPIKRGYTPQPQSDQSDQDDEINSQEEPSTMAFGIERSSVVIDLGGSDDSEDDEENEEINGVDQVANNEVSVQQTVQQTVYIHNRDSDDQPDRDENGNNGNSGNANDDANDGNANGLGNTPSHLFNSLFDDTEDMEFAATSTPAPPREVAAEVAAEVAPILGPTFK
ncbi:hypothetical protein P280DRAFT_503342 [Massarina eburnea CBS 473.64]|uniref:Uncharacterized protein n=1 Tax=Massarina eburnea CBS 473.64 TaxID=1395130 RepID=A0A6A6SGG7_9PLEO|nr:hypothetical protein P280DRAFT_503342 [Massarina eburnea CBS 473.64]